MAKIESRNEGTCRILIVDDDDYVAEFFGAFLQDGEYSVQVAVDFEGGWKAVQRGDYDVLFLDVQLPGADGLEILGEARRAVDRGKVVVMTGEISRGLRERAASLGINRCLAKPFDLEEIWEIVRLARVNSQKGPDAVR